MIDDSPLRFHEFLAIINEESKLQTPEFHLKIALWLEHNIDHPLLLLQAFRDAGKSRLLSAYVAWRLRRDPNFTVLIISAKRDLARRNSTFIRSLISDSILTEDLPPKSDELWQKQTFTVKRSMIGLEPSVQVTSLESDYVGKHAQLVIIDDGETADTTRTHQTREWLKQKMRDELVPLSSQFIYVGTPHGYPSIYTQIAADPDCRSVYYPIYTEDAEGNRTYTWPDRFPEKIVEMKKRAVSTAYWNSQYLLIPQAVEDTTLPVEFIQEYDDEVRHDSSAVSIFSDATEHSATIGEKRLVDLVASYDPAQSREGTDDAILAIVARDTEDNTYIHRVIKLPSVEKDGGGWAPQCDAVIDACLEVGCAKIVVESNTNRMMVSELKAAGNRKGNRLRIAIKDVFSTKNKAVRIADALEAVMASGRLYAHRSVAASPFFQQARDFPACTKGKAKNDAIDAVATGIANLKQLPKFWREGAKTIGGGFGRASSSNINPGGRGPGDRLAPRDRFAGLGRRRV